VALAVLTLASGTQLVSSTRVLTHREVQAVTQVQQLLDQTRDVLAEERRRFAVAADEALQRRTAEIEERTRKATMVQTLNFQLEYQARVRELRSQFVETVMNGLAAMLMPPPATFFARVQASASAMVGAGTEATLHVAAADEAAAKQALCNAAMRLVVNPDLLPGQCFLETGFGRIQASLATQLETIEVALREWWAAQPAAPTGPPAPPVPSAPTVAASAAS
jgi:flagellar biosynthesis/type III secretory pathway protein FliH